MNITKVALPFTTPAQTRFAGTWQIEPKALHQHKVPASEVMDFMNWACFEIFKETGVLTQPTQAEKTVILKTPATKEKNAQFAFDDLFYKVLKDYMPKKWLKKLPADLPAFDPQNPDVTHVLLTDDNKQPLIQYNPNP